MSKLLRVSQGVGTVLLVTTILTGCVNVPFRSSAEPDDVIEKKIEENQEKIEVSVTAEAEFNENKVKFIINSNLPDGSILKSKLTNVKENYVSEETGSIKDGKLETSVFTDDGVRLSRGAYTLEISSLPALDQPDRVVEIIGSEGEFLSGEFVVFEENVGNVVYVEQIIGMYEEDSTIAADDQERILNILVENGADITHKNNKGDTYEVSVKISD